jgi:hypothetical protein
MYAQQICEKCGEIMTPVAPLERKDLQGIDAATWDGVVNYWCTNEGCADFQIIKNRKIFFEKLR